MDKVKDEVLEEELVEKESGEEVLEEKVEKEEKTFTQEELDEIIQKRLDREMKKFEEKRSEAETLASMTAEERARAEFEKEKNEWLKEKTAFEKEKMKLEATKLLDAEGLPIQFVDYVLTDSAEGVKDNIKVFKEQWDKELDEAITERLKGKAPVSGSLQHKDIVNMTKEEFGKLSYRERAKMLEIDPDIMGKLKN